MPNVLEAPVPYEPPQVVELGPVEDLTLGGTGGGADGGGTFLQ